MEFLINLKNIVMAKKNKSVVIHLSFEDNLLLKKHQLHLEEIGVKKTKAELASDLFAIGLGQELKNYSK